MDDGLFVIGTRSLRDESESDPVSTERGKVTTPWAGGSTFKQQIGSVRSI